MMMKEWERIILIQRESLSQIGAHAEHFKETLEAGEPQVELIDSILELSLNRL